MQSLDVFFGLCLNKRLSKPSRRRRFQTPLRALCHCNVLAYQTVHCLKNLGIRFLGHIGVQNTNWHCVCFVFVANNECPGNVVNIVWNLGRASDTVWIKQLRNIVIRSYKFSLLITCSSRNKSNWSGVCWKGFHCCYTRWIYGLYIFFKAPLFAG